MKSKTNATFINSRAIIDDIETLFASSDCVLQDARNKIKKVQYENLNYVVKSFKKPNLLNRLIYTFARESKAKRSYEYSMKISQFVPQAVAYVEFYEAGLLNKSYFVSEMFDYDFTIREPLNDVSFVEREAVFKAFAKFSFELHQQGILHKDYSPGNILITERDGEYQFKIIDINRMAFGELSIQERMRSFKMLWATDSVLDFIVAEYARVGGYDISECQALAKDFNHAHKRFKNFKRRLKGLPVML